MTFEHVHLNYPAQASQTLLRSTRGVREPKFVSGILCDMFAGLFTRAGKMELLAAIFSVYQIASLSNLAASFSRKIMG